MSDRDVTNWYECEACGEVIDPADLTDYGADKAHTVTGTRMVTPMYGGEPYPEPTPEPCGPVVVKSG